MVSQWGCLPKTLAEACGVTLRTILAIFYLFPNPCLSTTYDPELLNTSQKCPLLGFPVSIRDTPGRPHHAARPSAPAILPLVPTTTPDSPVMKLFEETGAYLRGHFRLTSGLHSPEYLQCAKVLAHPDYAEHLGRELARRLAALINKSTDTKADLVVAPAMGGLIIGHEVARDLGIPFLFTERDGASNQMTLRRGFELHPGQSAVVIEDVITTGGSTREVIQLLQAAQVTVLAAGSIMDRSGGHADVGVPRVSLHQLNAVTYDPADCPLCREGIPVVKPGSRRAA